MEESTPYDLVIIGAGIHGIAALKTYRDVHPTASILVLDKGTSIGGVWAKDHLYPGLHTNNHFKTFFSDYPMSTAGYDTAKDHIPGEHVNEYLCSYAQEFDLLKYMRFKCKIESATDSGDSRGWTLQVLDETSGQTPEIITARKLIVATGLTSEPFLPRLEGREEFGAPIYHSSEFTRAERGLGSFKKVVLLGGAKIIPELLLQTRLITWLSPCIWGDVDGFASIRKFFHQSWFGRKIVDGFFAKMGHSTLKINNYDSNTETAKLKPWDEDVFFIGTNRGLLNYDKDFFEFVRDGTIRIHIEDITHLSDHTVHLSNDSELPADVLICGTGWKDTPPIKFVTAKEMGLPGFTSPSIWKYIPKAEAEIFTKCPKLQDQPSPRPCKPLSDDKETIVKEPYRLYRFMVPPDFAESRTLAFAGAYRSPATTVIAQAQALWITAFLDGQIVSLSQGIDSIGGECKFSHADLSKLSNGILYETVLHTQFGKWRYSRGFGSRFPEMWFDCLPYVDMLLQDVGVQNRRKSSWWGERFTPYWPKDYAGIVGEYLGLKDARQKKATTKETRSGDAIDGEAGNPSETTLCGRN
ncbi:FAD/NAD(P)-binding domain-containing protein [Pleomassaria siparia CBS 279.74]|uniref:FAD/NAD(P)-binding domain-containing protein n=1 Tax=Pleomassaria siparia CBS 279.74 TaxID=1314801 RepID=A0A6G1JS41_9PLEO|nr:FAD/NAD(P)-binding domain-containing protein [Pleomassaria siparia CBS 279.74]